MHSAKGLALYLRKYLAVRDPGQYRLLTLGFRTPVIPAQGQKYPSLFIHSSHFHSNVLVKNKVTSCFPSLQSLQMFKEFSLELPNLGQRWV